MERLAIRSIHTVPLLGESPRGGWSHEIMPEDSVHALIAVHTEEGITGFGSVFTDGRLVAAGIDVLEPLWRGENALEPERVTEKLNQNTFWMGRGGTLTHVISGIDMALWDILGKALGQPVGRLLVGGKPRIGPCVGRVGKFICVGLNYSDHAAESGIPVPEEPILFMKSTSAICGPDDDVIIPRGSEKTDWEVELGVVIGREARYVSEAEAMDHVAGYCFVNDISERSFQLERGGQWVKGKSADTFGPIGPWLVTPDEVPGPQNLSMWLEVDGRRFQQGSTRTMVFGVACLVSYISQFMSLQPGDIISTGTPPGVGLGQRPPVYLRAGQVMALGIDGLGTQRQRVVEAV